MLLPAPFLLLMACAAAAADTASVDNGILPDIQAPDFNFSTTGTYSVPGAPVSHTLTMPANATLAIPSGSASASATSVLLTTTDSLPPASATAHPSSSAGGGAATASAHSPSASASKSAGDARRPAAMLVLLSLAAVIAL